jgi:hypothetical protein
MLRIARTHVGLDRKIGRGAGGMVICLTALLGACRERAPTPRTGASAPIVAKVDRTYGKLQMSFEPNRGQTDARVSFLSRGGGYSLFLEPTEAVFALRKPSRAPAATAGVGRAVPAVGDHEARFKAHSGGETSVLGMRLVGANPAAAVVGEAPLPGKVNYYIGNDPKRWHENVPTFGKVRYSRVYPGVDVVYYGTEGRLEYDFVVAPGADPRSIRVAFDGAVPKLTADGEIVLSRGDAEVRLRNLIVYQEQGGVREPVSGRFVLAGDHQVRFAVADYDRSRALVIDPTVVYATYLGGPDNDTLWGLAVDSAGSAIVVGDTQTGGVPGGFPVTSSAFQATDPNPWDTAFVSKLSPDGSSLIFSTYLGGVGNGGDKQTVALAVAVDPQDGIYVGGWTAANNFPTTAGAFQPAIAPGHSQPDGFVTKLSPGGTMSYSTYLGGNWADYVIAIAVDAAGDAHVTGKTQSYYSEDATGNPELPPFFPTTPNAYQAPFRGPIDNPLTSGGPSANYEPFLSELDPTGSKLLYSTLLAPTTCVFQCTDGSTCDHSVPNSCATGSCNEYCGGQDFSVSIALGPGGIAYIGGYTSDPNFPTTTGALQTVAHPNLNANGAGGGPTGFIAAFDPTKSGAPSLKYSTFLGGRKSNTSDAIVSIAADADGNVYATGHTNSADFPTTPGAYATTACTDPTATHCSTIFATKLDPNGSKLVYSTVITDGADDSYQIAIDAARNAYLLSRGHNPNFRFIDPVSEMGGVSIQTLSADGSKLLFSTLFSSEVHGGDPPNNGFVVDKAGNIYVASTNGNHDLPATTGAFQTTPALDSSGRPTNDGYVVKISPIATSVPPPDGGVGGASGSGGAGGNLAGAGGSNGAGGAAGGAPGGKAGASGATGGLGGASAAGGAAGKAGASGATGGKGAPGDAGVYKPGSGGGGSGGGCSVLPSTFPASGTGLMGLLLLALRRRRKSRRDFGRWER